MKKNVYLSILAVLLVISVIFSSFLGEARQASAEAVETGGGVSSVSSLDFSLALLRECAADGENVLISPLCASSALTAVALGSSGDTRAQLESVLCSGSDVDSLAAVLGKALANSNGAVSLWLKDDGCLELSESYTGNIKSSFDAEISVTDFDNSTLDAMNGWVSDVTDGRIDSIIDEIPPEAGLYILSALSFDGEWTVPYTIENVIDGEFIATDGTVYDVQYMKSTESIYLETENAVGFAKPYTDGSYFIGLLPNEDVSMTDVLATLDGAAFRQMINNAQSKSVSVYLPKFTAESELSLSEAVIGMGAVDAFSPSKADFSALGAQPQSAYISDFLQNTYLRVDELGSQGGAAAGVEVSLKTTPAATVRLDRPFVYFIVKDGELLFAGVIERF